MLTNLIITALVGASGVILFEKWEVDDYMNTHGFWCKYWPAKPCLLCRGFWMGVIAYILLLAWEPIMYFYIPIAAIPLQVWLVGSSVKRL